LCHWLRCGEGVDAQDLVTEALGTESLAVEDRPQGCVPGNIVHDDSDLALYIIAGDEVEARDVRKQAQDAVDVGVLEVEADGAVGIGEGRRRGGGVLGRKDLTAETDEDTTLFEVLDCRLSGCREAGEEGEHEASEAGSTVAEAQSITKATSWRR
jgi:hypothetical protein